MSGGFWAGNTFGDSRVSTIAQVAFLLGLGLVAVALHVSFRIPLKLHGRHGIEWMALVLIGRLSVDRRGSASLVSVGAASASLLPYWGFKDPLMPLWFLLPGLVIDGGFDLAKKWSHTLPFLILVGGVAHATKPLLRAAAAAPFGLTYGFLRDGLLYGTLLHLVFGAVGGMLASLFLLGRRQLRRRGGD